MSYIMTVSAACRLSPTPPALMLSRNTETPDPVIQPYGLFSLVVVDPSGSLNTSGSVWQHAKKSQGQQSKCEGCNVLVGQDPNGTVVTSGCMATCEAEPRATG